MPLAWVHGYAKSLYPAGNMAASLGLWANPGTGEAFTQGVVDEAGRFAPRIATLPAADAVAAIFGDRTATRSVEANHRTLLNSDPVPRIVVDGAGVEIEDAVRIDEYPIIAIIVNRSPFQDERTFLPDHSTPATVALDGDLVDLQGTATADLNPRFAVPRNHRPDLPTQISGGVVGNGDSIALVSGDLRVLDLHGGRVGTSNSPLTVVQKFAPKNGGLSVVLYVQGPAQIV